MAAPVAAATLPDKYKWLSLAPLASLAAPLVSEYAATRATRRLIRPEVYKRLRTLLRTYGIQTAGGALTLGLPTLLILLARRQRSMVKRMPRHASRRKRQSPKMVVGPAPYEALAKGSVRAPT